MRKIVYMFFTLLLLSCGFNITGNGDPNHREQEIYYELRPLHFSMTMDCKKEKCSYYFIYYGYEYSKYTLKNDEGVFPIGKEFELPEDGHVRFSVYDYYQNERKYDIDVSEYSHSYQINGDSVEISLPLGTKISVYYDMPFEVSRDFSDMLVDTLPGKKLVFRDDSTFLGFYHYENGIDLGHENGDGMTLHGRVYWR